MGKVKTTSELVVCTDPKRVKYRRTRQRAPKFGNASLFSGSRYVAAVFFALFILDTRERVYVFAHADLVMHMIFFQLSFDIFLDHSLVTPYRVNIVTPAPKVSASVLVF